MSALASLRLLAPVGLALVTLTACSQTAEKDAADDAPKFTVSGTTTLSARPASGGGTTDPSPEPGNASHLRNEDGTYMLTEKLPGPGAVDEIVANYSGLENFGYQTLRAELDNRGFDSAVSGSAPTGVLQWAVGGILILNTQALNLSGDEADLENNAEWHVAVLDADGHNHLNESEDTEFTCSFGVCTLAAELHDAGSFNAEITIRQAGYEPFVIRQPILVAE